MEITTLKLSEIYPYEGNAKLHPQSQIAQIKESIRQFGNNDPIAVDENHVIIEGHGRYTAMKEMGFQEAECIILRGLTEDQKNAYRLVHNKLTMNSGFDMDALAAELENISIDMSQFDFDIEEPEEPEQSPQAQEDEYTQVEPKGEPVARYGNLYKLGRHYLLCGDSTKREDVEKLMRGAVADMVFTDPPYGMKKESDGVLNDNLNYDDLLEFNKKWIPLSFDFLKVTGGWYCWGIDEPLMDIYAHILKPLKKGNKIVIRNYITWSKRSAFGVSSPLMLCFPPETERCWFVVKGMDWNNNNSEYFNEKYRKILEYLRGEAMAVGLTPKKLRQITGVQMFSHWFSPSQFGIIPENHYRKLQEFYKEAGAFKMPHRELKALLDEEHDETKLKKPFFDLLWFDEDDDILTDVWRVNRTAGAEREEAEGHVTPKPIKICERGIASSSRKGEIVLDLFGGSGSTLIACEQLGRICYMMELEPGYCDVIIRRWESHTGQKAELLEGEENGNR